METDIKKLVAQLAIARADAMRARANRQGLVAALLDNDEYRAASAMEMNTADAVIAAENALRARALEVFEQSKERKLPGCEIKMTKLVIIPDQPLLRQWCLTNFTPALKLDMRAVEQAAKQGTIPDALATVEIEPKVYIAADLASE